MYYFKKNSHRLIPFRTRPPSPLHPHRSRTSLRRRRLRHFSRAFLSPSQSLALHLSLSSSSTTAEGGPRRERGSPPLTDDVATSDLGLVCSSGRDLCPWVSVSLLILRERTRSGRVSVGGEFLETISTIFCLLHRSCLRRSWLRRERRSPADIGRCGRHGAPEHLRPRRPGLAGASEWEEATRLPGRPRPGSATSPPRRRSGCAGSCGGSTRRSRARRPDACAGRALQSLPSRRVPPGLPPQPPRGPHRRSAHQSRLPGNCHKVKLETNSEIQGSDQLN